MQKLPEELDINAINVDRKRMKEQVSVVSKKISDLILEKHPSYSAELAKVPSCSCDLVRIIIRGISRWPAFKSRSCSPTTFASQPAGSQRIRAS